MLKIAKHTELSSHKHGPHFILSHQKYLREDAAGIEQIELPLEELVKYLDKCPNDPLAVEALALVCNNSGMVFNHSLYTAGERSIPVLFIVHNGRENELTGGLRKDALGNSFVSLHTLSVGRILAEQRDHPDYPDSASKIQEHIIALCKLLGLVPNLVRIKADLCATCGKK